MAKSIRSKVKRKMRALKRERVHAPRELARLKKTVAGLLAETPAATAAAITDAEMGELATVRDAADVVKEIEEKRRLGAASAYDPKTLRDAHGCYPPWMNQRRIRQHKARLQKTAAPPGKKKKPASTTARSTAPKRSGGGGGGGKKRAKKKSAW